MTEPNVEYKVGLPNGAIWIYYDKVKAENAEHLQFARHGGFAAIT